MADLDELYAELKGGGDEGDAFTQSELLRQGKGSNERLNALPQSDKVQLNRYAQSYDTPLTALLAAPYEGLKYVEQRTGVPVLSGLAGVMNKVGAAPVAPPRAGSTSPASVDNVVASIRGALARVKDRLTPRVTYDDMVKAKGKFTGQGNYISNDDSLGYRPLGMKEGVDLLDEEQMGQPGKTYIK